MAMTTQAPRLVSKHEFLGALTCATMVYFDRQVANAPIESGLDWRLFEGNLIGRLAREALGPSRVLPLLGDVAVTESTRALGTHTLLYEVTMVSDRLVARADALLPTTDGWELVEVKSSKHREDDIVKSEHIDDAAFTLMVAQLAGVPIARVSLMMLSAAFRRGAKHELFTRVDVTEKAWVRASELRRLIPTVVEALDVGELPVPRLQMACKECRYFSSSCIGAGVDDSILRLPRISERTLVGLQPHTRISQLPDTAELSSAQQRVVQLVKRRGAERDRAGLAKLDDLIWPVHYLDFEAVMPAVPWFDGDAPYTTTPFQFSIHKLERIGEEPQHIEYLALPDTDWRREITECLIQALDGHGSIVVYSAYERTRLNGLASTFPDLAPKLTTLISRLFDLEPFFRAGLVDYRYAGSSSIKKVLPVLVPELSYDNLEIGNGTAAAAVFSFMKTGVIPPEQHQQKRAELLGYCGLDTLAMLKLHMVLLREKGLAD